MSTRPSASFIIPTYNRGYIISSAIESILAQTNQTWEIIVVDDGSTDNTEKIVKSFRDKRITYVRQQNQGAATARNHGASLASAQWIAYLDSDNELLPTYLERMLQHLEQNSQAVFAIPRSHRTLELHEQGTIVRSINRSDDTPASLTLHDIFMNKLHFDTNGFMHLRRLFDEGIQWDPSFSTMEDWDIAMTIGERYPNGFLYVPEVLYNYHQRYGSDGIVSNATYSTWAEVFEQMYQKHKNDKLLQGQTWYPTKVEKWRRLQKEFEAGMLPPYHLYYFQ